MFWRKKGSNTSPLGIRLDDLLSMLDSTSIQASIEDNSLIARHEHYTTRVEVLPPEDPDSDNGVIQAIVRVKTELPNELTVFFNEPESTVVMNEFAALGALTSEKGSTYVGSRLTIYEAEDAWQTLHSPLLLFTTILGAEAILGGMKLAFMNESPQAGESDWTENDFKQVEGYLSRICVCTIGETRLTAEFGLTAGASSAAFGDHETALFQEFADQPHPALGPGLLCVLQMPHRIQDDRRLLQVCVQLNNMEMAPHDLPPHFGAWCKGKLGNNPAYVCFYPNVLHRVSGIAVNAGFWALNRAQWANAMLASMGIRA